MSPPCTYGLGIEITTSGSPTWLPSGKSGNPGLSAGSPSGAQPRAIQRAIRSHRRQKLTAQRGVIRIGGPWRHVFGRRHIRDEGAVLADLLESREQLRTNLTGPVALRAILVNDRRDVRVECGACDQAAVAPPNSNVKINEIRGMVKVTGFLQ